MYVDSYEFKDWMQKRQASLQSVLSEQEARNVALSEIKEDIRNLNGFLVSFSILLLAITNYLVFGTIT